MTDNKARFKRIIEIRKKYGLHYVSPERYQAQMDFYKQVHDEKLKDGGMLSMDGHKES